MKKVFSIIIILIMLISTSALADLPDISGLSFDELVALKEQINLAIWNSQEWQEVKVPVGLWKIGEDIPVGKWTITSPKDDIYITYCNKISSDGLMPNKDASMYYYTTAISGAESEDESYPAEIYLDCKDGYYIYIEYGPAIFSPYDGKPDLGFK